MENTYDKETDCAYLFIDPNWVIDEKESYEFDNGVKVNIDISFGYNRDEKIITGIEIIGASKLTK